MQDGAKLLVVDDDRMLLEFTERAVTSLGYSCVTATDAASALSRLEDDPGIRGMIIDMRLGNGPTGAELAVQSLEKWPDLGILLTSGDPHALQVAGQDLPQTVQFLPKPYRRRDLAERLSGLT